MSVSLVLKSLRKRREMSQQQLADALGVNAMTISRLESKENASFTPRMVAKIAGFIDDEDLSMFDPSDPQDAKIIEYPKNKPNHAFFVIKQTDEIWASDVREQIDAPMQEIGYTFVEKCNHKLYYQNKANKKYWLFICSTMNFPSDFHILASILRDNVGHALLYGFPYDVSKITFAISSSFNNNVARYLPQNISPSLPFDLSVLHFDDDGLIQQETYLRFNTDGRGIFDLDVDDTAVNAQAGKDYLAWTRAVGNIVMLEKNKK